MQEKDFEPAYVGAECKDSIQLDVWFYGFSSPCVTFLGAAPHTQPVELQFVESQCPDQR